MSVAQATERKQQTGVEATFQPNIVAFVCKWCTYAGADLAGTSRMTYAANVRALMLPCTGRIDIAFVIRAFLQGADGVMVSGCHPGDCHYNAGNYRARRRWTLLRDLLEVLGFDLRRLDMAWISAAEGAKWVKTIQSFTEKIRQLGPYQSMHAVARQRTAPIAPRGGEIATNVPNRVQFGVSSELIAAVKEALESGKVKAVIGWTSSRTLARARPAWITSGEAAKELVLPSDAGNLARLLKNPQLKGVLPIGMVARSNEVAALNVLAQEAQLDPASIVIFAIDRNGRFLGAMDLNAACEKLVMDGLKDLAADRPLGFSDQTLKLLDELMAQTPQQRWEFWSQQSEKCLRCYACRGSCPMCNCDQCFMDKNQPQWFPTASDGPGNLAWQIVRAFHLAGRCVGCGACEQACPAGIPLNILGAAMARSALKHFGHRAGIDPKGVPLQSEFKPTDKEDFIL